MVHYGIFQAISVVKDINNDYKYDVESILYAFANKFLAGKDLERAKEELKMTKLGKSLINEGKDEKTIEIVKKYNLKLIMRTGDVHRFCVNQIYVRYFYVYITGEN